MHDQIILPLVEEYDHRRSTVGRADFGKNIGFICGMTSAALIPRMGWRAVFYVGGVLPFALAILLIFVLPESVRFLSVRGKDPQMISRIMSRISPGLASVDFRIEAAAGDQLLGLPVKHLFTEGRTTGTLLLWVQFFMNLLLLYFNISWLPALIRQGGMSVNASVMAISLFSLGGSLGCFAQGPVIRAYGAHTLLLLEFGLAALFISLLSFAAGSFFLVVTLAFALGFCVTGAQGGINALAAGYYPTAIRSTGVGWALGIGRIGSILGPLLAGIMLSAGWTPHQIFRAGAIPALCAAAAVILTHRQKGKANAYQSEVDASTI